MNQSHSLGRLAKSQASGPALCIFILRFPQAVGRPSVRLHLTTTQGIPLDEKAALRRRKKLCRNWWNYEWLSRTLAMFQFLAGDRPELQIGKEVSQKLVISKWPISIPIGWSLDESQIEQKKLVETGGRSRGNSRGTR
jgi:hypothetical protein